MVFIFKNSASVTSDNKIEFIINYFTKLHNMLRRTHIFNLYCSFITISTLRIRLEDGKKIQ